MPDNYRIQEKGGKYRVVKEVERSFLWWSWTSYEPMTRYIYGGGRQVIRFDSKQEAHEFIAEQEEKDRYHEDEWTFVD